MLVLVTDQIYHPPVEEPVEEAIEEPYIVKKGCFLSKGYKG